MWTLLLKEKYREVSLPLGEGWWFPFLVGLNGKHWSVKQDESVLWFEMRASQNSTQVEKGRQTTTNKLWKAKQVPKNRYRRHKQKAK